MFQTISWVSLGLVLAGIVVHRLVSPRPRLAKGKAAEGSGLFRRGCCGENLSTLAKFNRLACMLAIASLLLLFVSGFAERMLFGEQIHGYTLMLHVGLAPVFVICAGVIAVAWGHQCRLNEDDRHSLAKLLCLKKTASADTADLGWKLTFWLAIFLVVPVSLSMVLSMFPIFGTHGQEWLMSLHQYTSLALTLVAMIHVYLVIRRKALCS
jgi:cytochrome b subunit of formate dehydrogenase